MTFLRIFCGVAVAFAWVAPASLRAADAPPPRLAVAISVDQLRADYLVRFRPHFGPDGFERLLSGGTDFGNCTYRYAATKTAVGHATMLSGAHPEVHGIVGNEWVDRETLLSGAAVEDSTAPLVGLAPTTMRLPGGTLDPRAGRSPRRFLAATVGDQLKATYGSHARVFGVSNKDRSAILMAGPRADGAFWDESGRMVTSTYYGTALPAWVEAFNARHLVESYHGETWERLLPVEHYDALQGPDDAAGELIGDGLDRTFPHVIDGGVPTPVGPFYAAFDNAPFANEFLEQFARELVMQERLGADDIPDLLCVSFSQVDSLGHNYGPDSHEIMDTILRLDRTIASFLRFLDDQVGRGRYTVVLTADHGVAPLPERADAATGGQPRHRVRVKELDTRMEAVLNSTLGPLPPDELWLVRDNQGYHVRSSALESARVERARAAQVLRDALRRDPLVETAYTRDEVLAASREGESLLTLIRRSYHDARSQDVVYVLKANYVEKADHGTTHGTPWLYDRHVPQVWYGAGVPRGRRTEPVGVEDIAPTLAEILRVPAPPGATGTRLF